MAQDIRILLAEDSPTVRRYLLSLIEETPDMTVVGQARTGAEAVSMVESLRPDLVSMDIQMPDMDGLEATRRIMAKTPTPIVVVSGLLESDVALSLQAIEAGALAVVAKPPDRQNPQFAEKSRQLLTTLRAMSSVKVISRRVYRQFDTGELLPLELAMNEKQAQPELIAIGASTGGPSALLRLLQALPKELPVPLLIVQHMPSEFIAGLVRWLAGASPLKIETARDGMLLERGVVIVASGGSHLTVARQGARLIARLIEERGNHRHQPSVDMLMESVAKVCGGSAIGVILTGMGDDGAKGLLAMRQAGAATLVQDEASSTVFGMPRAAIEIGAAQQVLPLANLASKIAKLL
jgi:two-component system, chemotaxis family, protein-glutamate methylesterase/glutaminase